MDVNAKLIKELRTQRSWTQQHLADACGISLRTVQRVERYGNASAETLMSLSSVFEMQKLELLTTTDPLVELEQVVTVDKQRERHLIFIGIVVGILIGIGVMHIVNLQG